jgi:PAS domain S-box-containing protein
MEGTQPAGDPTFDGLARAVLESASEGIVIANRAGTIVMVNARTEALFGYTRHELIGQPLEMLVPARVREAHVAQRRAYAEAPSIRPMGHGRDLAGRRKDGTEFPVEISLSFTETDRGTLFIAFVTDITERQRGIDALRRSESKAGDPRKRLRGHRRRRRRRAHRLRQRQDRADVPLRPRRPCRTTP